MVYVGVDNIHVRVATSGGESWRQYRVSLGLSRKEVLLDYPGDDSLLENDSGLRA
jgi:hypothetical protein